MSAGYRSDIYDEGEDHPEPKPQPLTVVDVVIIGLMLVMLFFIFLLFVYAEWRAERREAKLITEQRKKLQ